MGMDIVTGDVYMVMMDMNILKWRIDELVCFLANGVYYVQDFNAFVIYDVTHATRYNEVARHMPVNWCFIPSVTRVNTTRCDIPDERKTVLEDFLSYKFEDGVEVRDLVASQGWYSIEYLSV
jgi:hypothetical protein